MNARMFFFDDNRDNVKVYNKHLGALDIDCIMSDVRDISADVFVSPANSYGAMDGGIDEIYMEMFPGVETTVKNAITDHGIPDIWKRQHLPVGSAIIVPVIGDQSEYGGQQEGSMLVCAPTMTVPQVLKKGNNNVYWAMLAILHCTRQLPSHTKVAIPCLGTGVGKLSAEESVAQIIKAFLDYRNEEEPAKQIYKNTPGVYVACKT